MGLMVHDCSKPAPNATRWNAFDAALSVISLEILFYLYYDITYNHKELFKRNENV